MARTIHEVSTTGGEWQTSVVLFADRAPQLDAGSDSWPRPVQFVSEAFRYGGGAPEEIDPDAAMGAISLCKRKRLVDLETIED